MYTECSSTRTAHKLKLRAHTTELRERCLYTILIKLVEKRLSFSTHAKKMTDLETWHKRLGQANEQSTSFKKCDFFAELVHLVKFKRRQFLVEQPQKFVRS